jgi:hypothetical protein
MTAPEIILRLGSEGGRSTLYGIQTGSGWEFSFETYDCTPLFLNEEDLADLPPEYQKPILERSASVTSWEEALALLDRRPWENLYPEFVHPEFRRQVWDAIESRFAPGGRAHLRTPPEFRKRALSRWRRVCDGLEA